MSKFFIGGDEIVVEGEISAGNIVPVGTIVAYNPGYYTDSSNGGFTVIGPAGNTIAQINAYLPSNWRVCDGSDLLDSESPIFGGSGRYLPNLSNDRFLMGAASAGNAGGTATVTLAIANLPSHNHSMAHTHSISHNHASFNTSTTGSHSHTFEGNAVSRGGTGASTPNRTVAVGDSYTFSNFTPSGSIKGAGAHTHAIDVPSFSGTSGGASSSTTGNSGSSSSFGILPTYLSTYYIMRIK